MSRLANATATLLLLLAAGDGLVASSPEVAAAIERGDAAWRRRGDGELAGRPRPEPIGEALASYEAALADDPANLEACWKLQRALYFQGEYVATTPAATLAAFARGRDLGEAGLDRLAAAVGGRERIALLSDAALGGLGLDRRTAAELYLWTAAHWGLWGRTRGRLAAAREGVAATVRDYASASVALDPSVENGGGHRILGRLHSEAPRIPFITGWVSQATAVAELERARDLAPEDLLTRLYLAEALLEADRARRPEALRLLREVAASEPSGEFVVEDTTTIGKARRLLDTVEG